MSGTIEFRRQTSISKSAPSSTLLNNLQAYWYMDETSGAITDEVGSVTSTGTVGSTAIEYSATGINGTCLEFNYLPTYGSGQRIIVGNDLYLYANTSISLWFYLTSTDRDSFCLIHNNNGGSQNAGYFVFTGGVGGGVAARAYYAAGSYLEIDSASETSPWTVPSANTWYHLVFVSNGTNMSIYINNTLRAQDSFAHDIYYGSDCVFIIGGRDSGNGWCFNGRIDEIGIWNRALTTDEISELYNSGSGKFYNFA